MNDASSLVTTLILASHSRLKMRALGSRSALANPATSAWAEYVFAIFRHVQMSESAINWDCCLWTTKRCCRCTAMLFTTEHPTLLVSNFGIFRQPINAQ